MLSLFCRLNGLKPSGIWRERTREIENQRAGGASPGLGDRGFEDAPQSHGSPRKDSRSSATREETLETLGVAIYMGAGPAAMYASHALGAYTQFAAPKADAA
jgi:hypothetical protein